MSSNNRATKISSMFRLECSVSCDINASSEKVWQLLTDAKEMSRWNSTITRIEGEITKGQRLALEVPAAPGRTFKPTVTEYEANRRMVWSDGMAPMFKGVRTYTLTPNGNGYTNFSMIEKFTGIMMPIIKRSLPDFAPIFEIYAADLKREAERSQ